VPFGTAIVKQLQALREDVREVCGVLELDCVVGFPFTVEVIQEEVKATEDCGVDPSTEMEDKKVGPYGDMVLVVAP
jgi:hypothetical protein